MEWICPVDYDLKYKTFIRQRYSDTGDWFLQDPRFREWEKSNDATLLCQGHPGAGKTILTTVVIHHLRKTSNRACHPTAFIYCDYLRQSEQSADHMLSSLLRQIVEIHPVVPKPVRDCYHLHKEKRTEPLSEEIKQLLETTLDSLEALTVVVDALDECELHVCEEFLSTIENLRERHGVRLFAMSRIMRTIASLSIFSEIPSLEIRASNQDVQRYTSSRVKELRGLVRSDSAFCKEITSKVTDASGGM